MIGQVTIKAYIGSNNKTKELEIDKIISVLNKNHDEFTIQYPVIGYWRGEAEQTAILLLAGKRKKVMNTLRELKEVLHQDAIAYQIDRDLKLI